MKRFIVITSAMFLGLLIVGTQAYSQEQIRPKNKVSVVRFEKVKPIYTCPMHLEVTSPKPGACAKCGMNLVKKQSDKLQEKPKAKKALYACPMHPNVQSDKPENCSECGMKLEKVKSSKSS